MKQLPLKVSSFSDFVKPLCLPQEDIQSPTYPHSGKIIVSGWGKTKWYSKYTSTVLMYTDLPIIDISYCFPIFKPRRYLNSQLCTGNDGGKDSCQGDSGS